MPYTGCVGKVKGQMSQISGPFQIQSLSFQISAKVSNPFPVFQFQVGQLTGKAFSCGAGEN